MLLALFTLWSIPFFILMAVLTAGLIFCVEQEHEFIAFVLIAAAFTGFAVWGGFNVVTWALAHPVLAAGGVLGYFTVGAVWSLAKWKLYARAWRKKFDEQLIGFLRWKGIDDATGDTPVPAEHAQAWFTHCHNGSSRNAQPADWASKPNHRDKGARIKSWIGYWPWSMTWFLIHDPLTRAVRAIYERLERTYQSITNTATAGVDDLLKAPPDPPSSPAAGEGGDDANGGRRDGSRRGGYHTGT